MVTMSNILDANGKPIEKAALAEPQTSKLAWIQNEWAEHPSRGLTPARLHRLLNEAETGDLMAQADLFCDMEEKDAHIFAELSKRKRALLTLDWRVQAPPGASAAEKKLAEEVREWISAIADFEDVMLDGLDAIGHGFAAQEITWARDGALWIPAAIEHRPQRWFRTLPYDGNALRLRDASMYGAELWPFGWIVHRHKAKSGYLTRGGLHRILCWPFLFKNYGVRDLAEFLEIYGLPLRLGKYPVGTTDAEKATLLRAVASIGHDAAGIIPAGMEIEFEAAASGSQDPFEAMISWAEKSESKAILGGTLTSQADGKSSTHALGNVHNEVRHDLLVSDARQLEATLTRQLIWPMVTLNRGGDLRRCPRLVFDTREVVDLKLYADTFPKLVASGLKIGQEWAQEKLGIPIPAEGENLLAIARPELEEPPALRPAERELPLAEAATRIVALSVEPSAPDDMPVDQAEIDRAAVPEAAGEAMRGVMGPALKAIKGATTPDEAYEALSAAYPAMDDEQLSDLLTQAIFVAETWGRLNA